MQHISASQVCPLQAAAVADAGCHHADAYNICNKADYYSLRELDAEALCNRILSSVSKSSMGKWSMGAIEGSVV